VPAFPRRALLLLAALACGCAAKMLETHGDRVQLLKTGQEKPGRGGVISYGSYGPASIKKARRANAEKQMRAFCSGDYAVTAEGPRSKLGASVPTPAKAGVEFDEVWYVVFECAEAPR
jgi:hypothetical protein